MKLTLSLVAASGPLLTLTCVRFLTPASAHARRRAGCGRSADCLPSLREGALRCSTFWPVAELTSLAALSAFKQPATSQSTKRADARGQQVSASRRRTRRCARTPPGALRVTVSACAAPHATTVSATGHPGSAQRASEALRSTGLVARARSAPRRLTRRVCLSAVSAANGASYAAGPLDRAPQGSRSEAKTASAARCALPGCPVAAPLSAKRKFSGRNVPKADRRSMRVSCTAVDALRQGPLP